MHWIIEDVHSDNGDKELADAARAAGHAVTWLTPLRDIQVEHLPAPSLFHGSIEKAIEIKQARPDITVFFDQEKFKCTNYFPAVKDLLLNSEYTALTVAELKTKQWDIYRQYAVDTKIFVRPDSGIKTFTGCLLDLQDFDRFWKHKVMCQAKDEDIVLASSPKDILGEWRFICSPEGISAVSCYKYQGNQTYIPSSPKDVTEFCLKVLERPLQLGPMFILDIAQSKDGRLGLVEANAFSTGALYAADKTKIISTAGHLFSSIMIDDLSSQANRDHRGLLCGKDHSPGSGLGSPGEIGI